MLATFISPPLFICVLLFGLSFQTSLVIHISKLELAKTTVYQKVTKTNWAGVLCRALWPTVRAGGSQQLVGKQFEA